MNILFITRFYPEPKIGGIERVTKLLTEYLHKQRHHVHCLHFEPSEYDGSLGEMLQAHLLEDKYDKTWILQYLRSNSIDVVINQSHFFYAPFLSMVVHEAGIKLITCCHSSTRMETISRKDAVKLSHGLKRWMIWFFYPLFKAYSVRKLRKIHVKSFNCSDKTIVLSESIDRQYRRDVLGISPDDRRLDYIYNPLSFTENIETGALHKKENIVLVVARLYEPQKTLSLLFEAWGKIKTDGWEMVIVGDGEDRMLYEQMVNDLRITNVRFVGQQPPLSYYEKAKVFAMTSDWEGLPMTILESLQMGVVTIVMDSFPAAEEMIEDGKNGFLVAYPDVDAFADRLQQLMDDDGTRQKMAGECLLASKRYNMDTIGKRWMEVFEQMMEK